jgi:hypothetical protein
MVRRFPPDALGRATRPGTQRTPAISQEGADGDPYVPTRALPLTTPTNWDVQLARRGDDRFVDLL